MEGRAEALGATVVTPLKGIRGVGRRSLLRDPVGALFGFYE